MVYSYSGLNTFAQCPRKWYETYVNKHKSPPKDYFAIGRISHRVAELATLYCYDQTFKNKAHVFLEKDDDFKQMFSSYENENDFFEDLLEQKNKMLKDTRFENFGILLWTIDTTVETSEYELVTMPERDEYERMFTQAVAEERVTAPEIIEEAHGIVSRFYNYADFSVLPHETILAEQKLAFTRDWEKTGFFSDNAYFRGVIDHTLYNSDKHVTITDYKTSRTMLNKYQLAEDPQLKSYVNMIVRRLGRENVESVTIRLVYMRFLETIEWTFDDIDSVLESATGWINGLVEQIEERGDDINNFETTRNQYCGTCHVRELGLCPLFKKVEDSSATEGVTDWSVSNEVECAQAFKRAERLKEESNNLMKECKNFIETTDGVVHVDGGILDKVYNTTRKFDPVKVASVALKKEVKLADILKYFSITEANFKKMSAKLVEFTDEEIDEVSKESKRSKFDVFTRE